MLKTFIVDRTARVGAFLAPYPSDIKEYCDNPDNILWINCGQSNIDWITREFGISQHTIALCQDTHPIPYVEMHSHMMFIRAVVLNPEKMFTAGAAGSVCFIVMDNCIISVCSGDVEAFDLLDSQTDTLAKIGAKGSDNLLVFLLKSLADQYAIMADRLCGQVDVLECEIEQERTAIRHERILELHRILSDYHKLLNEQRHVAIRLCKNQPVFFTRGVRRDMNHVRYMLHTLVLNIKQQDRLLEQLTSLHKMRIMLEHTRSQNKLILLLFWVVLILMACSMCAIVFLFPVPLRYYILSFCGITAVAGATGYNLHIKHMRASRT